MRTRKAKSMQIRIDRGAFECLSKLSQKHRQPVSGCASEVIRVFRVLAAEIEKGNKLVLVGPDNEKREPMFPMLGPELL